MATKAKNRKTFKQHLLLGHWLDFKIISQKCSLGDALSKLLKWFCSAEQIIQLIGTRYTMKLRKITTTLCYFSPRAKTGKNFKLTSGQISNKHYWNVSWMASNVLRSTLHWINHYVPTAFKYEYQVLHLKQMFSGE